MTQLVKKPVTRRLPINGGKNKQPLFIRLTERNLVIWARKGKSWHIVPYEDLWHWVTVSSKVRFLTSREQRFSRRRQAIRFIRLREAGWSYLAIEGKLAKGNGPKLLANEIEAMVRDELLRPKNKRKKHAT